MLNQTTYQNNSCYLCKNEDLEKVPGSVRDYPNVNILKCKKCGLVFLDSFKHIDETYYENSRMLTEANLSLDKWTKENYEQNKCRAKDLTSSVIRRCSSFIDLIESFCFVISNSSDCLL